MKTVLSLAAGAAALAPASALAHAGAHAHVEEGLLAHLVESPFHIGVVAVALALVGYGAIRTARPLKSRVKRDR